MTAVQERLTAMAPKIPSLAPMLSEDNAQTIINILVSVQNGQKSDEPVKKYKTKTYVPGPGFGEDTRKQRMKEAFEGWDDIKIDADAVSKFREENILP